MKRKGFTIVELLVVIAIVAILATVSIIGYTAFTRKANISDDKTLISQLNTYVKSIEIFDDIHSLTDVANSMESESIDFATLKTSTKNYRFGFDLQNKTFCLIDDNWQLVDYQCEDISNILAFVSDINDFVSESIVIETDEIIVYNAHGYSAYLQSGIVFEQDAFITNKGFDSGAVDTIKSAYYYSNTDDIDYIYTSICDLYINAASATLYHNGFVANLNVTAIGKGECYHENGYVSNIQSFESGRFVVDTDATFHQSFDSVAAVFENNDDVTFELGNQSQFNQHAFGSDGVCYLDDCTFEDGHRATNQLHNHRYNQKDYYCICGKANPQIDYQNSFSYPIVEHTPSDQNQIYLDFALNPNKTTYTLKISANFDAVISMDQGFNLAWAKGYVGTIHYIISQDVEFELVDTVILSDGCKKINGIAGYKKMKTLIVEPCVQEFANKAFYFPSGDAVLKKIIFIGDVPKINDTGLYLRSRASIYVHDDVASKLNNYLQGYFVRKMDYKENYNESLTAKEYVELATQQAINIAQHLTSRCDNEITKALCLYPYSTPEEFAEIKAFTLELTKNCKTQQEKSLEIYKWVSTNIEYQENGKTCYEAFRDKLGCCCQFTMILHDMYSAVGIPSFYVSGEKEYFGLSSYKWTIEEIVNYRNTHQDLNHAWLIAKVDEQWRFYDATTSQKQLNMNLFAMDSDTLISYGRTVDNVEGILCIPECVDYHLKKEANFIYKDGEVIGIYNNGYDCESVDSKLYYNGSALMIHKKTYPDPDNRPSFFFLDDQERCYGVLVTNCFSAYKLCYENKNFSYGESVSGFCFYTGSGRIIKGVEVLRYLVNEFGVDKVNPLLTAASLTLDESKVYLITDQGNVEVATY